MNFVARRFSWISLIVAAAISVGLSQPLVAQPGTTEQEAPGAPGAAEAAGPLKTLAVISGARYEKLIGDITFLGPYLGQPAAGQMAEMVLAQYTMNKAATAIDKSKPWGVIVQTDGQRFYYVVCLPIANGDDVIEIAKLHNAEVKDAENGNKEISVPGIPPLFMKAENGVVFLSIAQSSLAKLPPNPLEILGNFVGDYDLSVALSVKNIPEMHRQMAIGAIQAGLQQNMKQGEGESDEEFATKQKLADAQLEQIKQLINEVDTVKVGWAIDAKEKRTFLDFDYKFVPGSKFAQQMAAYTKQGTDFSGFYQPDAAVTAMVVSKLDPKLAADNVAQMESTMRGLHEQIEREIDKNHKGATPEQREALKGAVGDIFGAIEATIKEGHVDGGGSLNLGAGTTTLVIGTHVKEPGKIEDALKKIESAAKDQPDFPGIKWDAANHGDVKFHTLTAPVAEHKEVPHKMFGETVDISVGIGANAVYVAVGKDSIAAVGKAIDASASGKGKEVTPITVSASLGPILEFVAETTNNEQAKQVCASIAEKLKRDAKGRDHIRMTGDVVDRGLRYRLEAEEGALQAIGKAAMMKAQGRQAAGN